MLTHQSIASHMDEYATGQALSCYKSAWLYWYAYNSSYQLRFSLLRMQMIIVWLMPEKLPLFFGILFLALLPFNWHCLLHKLYFIKDSFILVNLFFPLSVTAVFQIQSEWAAGIVFALLFYAVPIVVEGWPVICVATVQSNRIWFKIWLHRVTSEIFAVCLIKILFQKLLIRAKSS